MKTCPQCGYTEPTKTSKAKGVPLSHPGPHVTTEALYAYYAATSTTEDLKFYRPGCSPAIQARIDALLEQGKPSLKDVRTIFEAWRMGQSPLRPELWDHERRATMRELALEQEKDERFDAAVAAVEQLQRTRRMEVSRGL